MTPYFNQDGVVIIQGDALSVLTEFHADTIHCCVTSPPYWGLRDYGIEPSIWDGTPGCRHEWGPQMVQGGPAGEQGSTGQRSNRRNIEAQLAAGKPLGNFCQLCGAWRGCLGLEPTPELYVAHIVQVFREVRRVLRPEGTLWLNLGDSYATGGGKVGDCPGGGEQGERWKGRKGKDCDPKRGASAEGQPLGHPVGYRGNHDADPKWAGQHPGRMKQNGLDTRAGAALGPMTQPNRFPIAGLKPKDLVGIPWRVAFALQADGWYLRSDIIWHKPNPMPESVKDRPTKAHEYLFLLAKSEQYYYDAEAIKEPATGNAHDRARKERSAQGQKSMPTTERNGVRPGVNPKAKWPSGWASEGRAHTELVGRYLPKQNGNKERKVGDGTEGRLDTHLGRGIPWPGSIRPKQNESFSAAVIRTVDFRNKRSVWTLSTKPFKEAHFATFPEALIEPCIKAGCPQGGVVLDPFAGAGTVGLVAKRLGRGAALVELKEEYCAMAVRRLFPEKTEPMEAAG